MGWRKKAKKLFRKAKSIALLDPGTKMVKGLVDGQKEEKGSSGEEGLRSAAAKRLVNKNQQAGSGSINFNTEEYVE